MRVAIFILYLLIVAFQKGACLGVLAKHLEIWIESEWEYDGCNLSDFGMCKGENEFREIYANIRKDEGISVFALDFKSTS